MHDNETEVREWLKKAKECRAKARLWFEEDGGSIKEFKTWWVDRKESYSQRPVDVDSMRRRFKIIDDYYDNKDVDISEKSFTNAVEGVHDFITAVNEYRKYLKKTKRLEKIRASSKQKEDESPYPMQYNVYYYHHVSQTHAPTIGRTVLTLISEKDCSYKNVPQGGRPNYKGTYKVTSDCAYFELSNNRRHTKLFITALLERPKVINNISMASYLTFEDNHPVSGTMIIVKKNRNILPAKVLKTGEEIPDIEVAKAIRNYLSIRRLSYHPIPRISTSDDLQTYFEEGRFAKNPKTRIAQIHPHPKVFIAVTSSLRDNRKLRGVVQDVLQFLKDKYTISEKHENLYIFGLDQQDRYKNIEQNLNLIKKCSLFISFVGKSDVLSFTGLEMGVAWSYCNSVIIFQEEKAISDRIKQVGQLEVKTFSEFSDQHLNRIKSIIANHLTNLSA